MVMFYHKHIFKKCALVSVQYGTL